MTLDSARQENLEAIALFNQSLPEGITAKATIAGDNLKLVLEGTPAPNREEAINLVEEAIASLSLQNIERVTVIGQDPRELLPSWTQAFKVVKPVSPATPFERLTSMVSQIGDTLSSQATQATQAVAETTTGTVEAIGSTVFKTGAAVVETAAGVGGAIAGTATQVGKVAVEAATGVGEAIGGTSKTVAKTAVDVGGNAAKQTYHIFTQVSEFIAGTPLLQRVVKQVDLTKAETTIRLLKQKYPNESPSQIAHRLMVQKAVYSAGTGLVSSLVPGFAVALIAVDLTTTAALQAEMVYQIAAAYGMDLKDPARQGEVLAIFGLALGGGRAIKAGLTLLREAPVAGAVIGASSNAVMIYSVGYAACRFYEGKQKDVTITDSQEANENYIEMAIAQQTLMDQILVHIILAGHPEKTWEELLPELEALNLNQASLAVIKTNLQSPPPLDNLLNQLNRDFAMPLIAQCDRMAKRDGVTTPEEAKVIQLITQKFGIEPKVIEELQEEPV